jgi:hypothetical protein
MSGPNILLIMTDDERNVPPYEDEALKKYRKEQLSARASIRDGALEFNLTADPEKRIYHLVDAKDTVRKMQSVVSARRDAKRLPLTS